MVDAVIEDVVVGVVVEDLADGLAQPLGHLVSDLRAAHDLAADVAEAGVVVGRDFFGGVRHRQSSSFSQSRKSEVFSSWRWYSSEEALRCASCPALFFGFGNG
ncbi:hypothetical protein [Streptomyces sp. NBC_01180]|uniref:hypothetical protein n=1 Tax=Streptomyces sp. NBC_01180 TaxID=2903763 RepID=UPI003869167B|nr:hypothetical protein OG708_34610 [Streptomyces sp. NBC_01180]